jgi:hypothetical protein
MKNKEEPMIPEQARAEIHASYVRSVKDTPEIVRALQERGRLGDLDRVAEEYAETMLVECERLANNANLEETYGQMGGFWPAWQRFIQVPTTRLEEGRAWLPSRAITLKGLPEPTNGHSKVTSRKVGFEPPAPLPPPPPVTIADVERIVARAIAEAASEKPAVVTHEVESTDAAGQTKKTTVTTRRAQQ